MKKIIALLMAAVFTLTLVPSVTLEAKSSSDASPVTWVTTATNTYSLSGTDIVVTLADATLTVTGSGELPDYTIRNYRTRPWNGAIVNTIKVADTITYIGAYNFANMAYVTDVYFSAAAFVSDASSFYGINSACFHVTGTSISTKYYGSIAYTSLDSIQSVAYNQLTNRSWVFDKQEFATSFQNSCNPTIANVYVSWDSSTPWKYEAIEESYKNGFEDTDYISISAAIPMKDCEVTQTNIYVPGVSILNLWAANIGTYKYGLTFDMTVTRAGSYTMSNTLYGYYYVFTLPSWLASSGRTFKVMATTTGGVEILDDCDTSDTTVTFLTNDAAATFCLIYQ